MRPRPTQLQQVLDEGAGQDIRKFIEDLIKLEIRPGKLVRLRTPGTPEEFRLELTPMGALRSHHPLWGHDKALPEPGDNEDTPSWGSMGAWNQVVRDDAAQWLIRNWEHLGAQFAQKPPTENRAAAAISHWLRKNGTRGDQELSREILAGIRSLIDPEIYRLAASLNSGKVSVNSYNIARLGRMHLDELLRTNPGIITWAMGHGTPQEEINHPGQIIKMAHDEFNLHGLEPGAWKNTAAISQDDMQAISMNRSTSQLVDLFNILARTRIPAQHPAIQHINQELGQMTPNMTLAAELFLRGCQEDNGENRNDHEARREFQDIRDYVAHLDARQERLPSRSIAGLRERSDRWHRDLRQNQDRLEWEMTISRQGYEYSAWNSLIGETRLENLPDGPADGPAECHSAECLRGMTAVPLVNHRDLHEESVRMGHCVHQYVEQCRSGESRIFSILKDSRHIATGELREENNSWRPVQVRGINNQRPIPAAEAAMERLAREYTKSWRLNPSHTDWYIQERPE